MEKAALDFATAAMSPIMEKLGIMAASYFGGDITRKELHHLQTIILPKIRTVIKAAEKIDVATLRPWLMELQAAAYEAEDVLDMYEYNKIKNEEKQSGSKPRHSGSTASMRGRKRIQVYCCSQYQQALLKIEDEELPRESFIAH